MNPLAQKNRRDSRHGFTLVEMLVAMTILALIMVMASQMIGATSKIWKNTTAKIEAFQNARDGFQLLTDELRQATCNTYWDYYDASGFTQSHYANTVDFKPVAYGRQSDLHFRCSGPTLLFPGTATGTQQCFFQAPLGYVANPALYGNLESLLNSVGFYVMATTGTNVVNAPPPFLNTTTPPYRYRLMQFIQPAEQNTIFNYGLGTSPNPLTWFTSATGTATNTRVVANNIVALIFCPKITDSVTDTLSSNYAYDSRIGLNSGSATTTATGSFAWTPGTTAQQPLQMNQAPPIIRVAMVAIDEPSARTLAVGTTGLSGSITAAFNQVNPGGTGFGLFKVPQYMDSDLLYFQYGTAGLAKIKPRLNFRVFTTTVVVRSARFSTQ